MERSKPCGSSMARACYTRNMNKPACPVCRTRYPVWKLILFRTNRLVCSSCGTGLGFSVKSSQRIGAIGGLTFAVTIVPLLYIRGLSILSWWPLLPAFLILFYFIGGLTRAFTGQLVPFKKQSWKLDVPLPGESRHRFFIMIGITVGPACMLTLCFGWFVPIWILAAVSLVMTVTVAIGTIGMVNLLFGKQGVFRRSGTDNEGQR